MIGRTPLLLVLGGAHSGRGDYVEERLKQALTGGSVLYVATLPSGDRRIAWQVARRDARWRTVEVGPGGDVTRALAGERGIAVYLDGFEAVLRAAAPPDVERAEAYAIEVADALRAAAGMIAIVVSSEVGMGVEAAGTQEAELRERLGAANRALAATAEEVVLVVAGLPVQLKGELP